MNRLSVRLPFSLFFMLTTFSVHADTIVDQSTGLTYNNITSQSFPDFPDFSTKSFDDFSTSQPFELTSLTVLGSEGGDPTYNNSVVAEIWTGSPGAGSMVLSAFGIETGSNLQFAFSHEVLPVGSYWLTAYVDREYGVGGQWFWNTRTPVTGNEALVVNPGGGFGYGSGPVPISMYSGHGPEDLAFVLSGDPLLVPELDGNAALPALVLLGTGLLMTGGSHKRLLE